MNVVRHDYVGMELIVSSGSIPISDRVNDYRSDLRALEVERAGRGGIQKAIHRNERCPRRSCLGKPAIRRKTSAQPPRDERRLTDTAEVRKSPNVKCTHSDTVRGKRKNSPATQQADCQPASQERHRNG